MHKQFNAGSALEEVWSEKLTQTCNDDGIKPENRGYRRMTLSWRLQVVIISTIFCVIFWKHLILNILVF